MHRLCGIELMEPDSCRTFSMFCMPSAYDCVSNAVERAVLGHMRTQLVKIHDAKVQKLSERVQCEPHFSFQLCPKPHLLNPEGSLESTLVLNNLGAVVVSTLARVNPRKRDLKREN